VGRDWQLLKEFIIVVVVTTTTTTMFNLRFFNDAFSPL
jgi:hypothetical protein